MNLMSPDGGTEPRLPNRNRQVVDLDIQTLVPLEGQPRQSFDETALEELAQSIRTYGILQPLIVSAREDGRYTIIAGERRWRASQIAGLATVPCLLRRPDEHSALEIALIENIQREELSAVEEAKALDKLMAEYNYTQETLAAKIGKERSTVANSLRLLTLPTEILEDLERKELTAGHARALCSLDDRKQQLRLRDLVLRKRLSVRQTEELVRKYKKGRHEPRKLRDHLPQDLRVLCDQFKGHLGTKVRITGTRDRGRVEISYYDTADLERIADLILGAGLDGELGNN